MKLLPTVSPFRARLLIAVLALPLVQPMAARAQNPVFSGPPFLGIPLVDMKLSVTNTANGLQLQWINANPQLTASYEVYRNTGSGFVLLTPAHVGATSFSDRPSPVLPRMAVTYEVEAFWSNGTKGVSGPVSMTMASAPMDLHPGPQPLPDRRCFGRADLSAVNIYTVPPDYLGTVSLQFAFPSATQFPGGANVIVKDSRNQAVTTYHMAYVQNAPVAGGFYPGYAYALPLGKHGDHVQLSLDVTVEAINADCSYHSFSTHWQNAGGVL